MTSSRSSGISWSMTRMSGFSLSAFLSPSGVSALVTRSSRSACGASAAAGDRIVVDGEDGDPLAVAPESAARPARRRYHLTTPGRRTAPPAARRGHGDLGLHLVVAHLARLDLQAPPHARHCRATRLQRARAYASSIPSTRACDRAAGRSRSLRAGTSPRGAGRSRWCRRRSRHARLRRGQAPLDRR